MRRDDTAVSQSICKQAEEGRLEVGLCRTNSVRGVSEDHVIVMCGGGRAQECKAIAKISKDTRGRSLGHSMASSMLLTMRPVLPGDFLRMTRSGGCVSRKPVA
jgi:hypothetical protein